MNAIYRAESADHMAALRALFVEYAESLDYHLCFRDFEDELARLPEGYINLLLADVRGVVAGCAGLSDLGGGVCELRRLYVRPAFRGHALGRRLAEAILDAARGMGCARVTLETLPSMQAARALYDGLGFARTGPPGGPGEGPAALALDLGGMANVK